MLSLTSIPATKMHSTLQSLSWTRWKLKCLNTRKKFSNKTTFILTAASSSASSGSPRTGLHSTMIGTEHSQQMKLTGKDLSFTSTMARAWSSLKIWISRALCNQKKSGSISKCRNNTRCKKWKIRCRLRRSWIVCSTTQASKRWRWKSKITRWRAKKDFSSTISRSSR